MNGFGPSAMHLRPDQPVRADLRQKAMASMVWKGGEPRSWEDHMGEVIFMLRRYVRMAARDCRNFQSSKTM